jgi:hypothetical protein
MLTLSSHWHSVCRDPAPCVGRSRLGSACGTVEGWASLPIRVCSLGAYAAARGGLWRDVRSTETDACAVRSPHRGLERSKREAATVPWLPGIGKETRMQRTTRMGVVAFVGASLIVASTVEQYAHVASGGFGRHSRWHRYPGMLRGRAARVTVSQCFHNRGGCCRSPPSRDQGPHASHKPPGTHHEQPHSREECG